MRFKGMMLALLACMVVSVIAASAAKAVVHWNVGGSELVGPEEFKVSAGPWKLAGSTLGTTVEINGEGIDCNVNCILSSGEISGSFTLTKAVVAKPANCTVGNPGGAAGSFSTNSFHGQVIMDPFNGAGPLFYKFTPATGTAFFEIEFHGEECALSEFALPVEGSVGGESSNATGVEKSKQSLTFGAAQQTTSGSALTLGGGTIVLSGTVAMELAGANAGQAFGPTE